MQTGIMITNDGPHSADDWALTTATMLINAFEIKPGSPRAAQLEIAKDRARANIAEIMTEHHVMTQSGEREMLSADANGRIGQLVNANDHSDVEKAITQVREAVQPLLDILESAEVKPGVIGMPVEHLTFEDHLMSIIRQRVEMDIHSVMDIERRWHMDRNPQAA